jgi:hypothetical protein
MGEEQLLGEGGKQRLILRIDVEGICCPKGTYSMKWSNRTAQAFRPGKAALEFALKGRPKQLGIMWRLIVVDNDTCRSKVAHSVALLFLRPAFPELRRTSRAAAITNLP